MIATEKVCYAITSGKYSDYHVCAVFSSRELADAKLPLFGEDANIEEFPFDPEIAKASASMLPFVCYHYYMQVNGRYQPEINVYCMSLEHNTLASFSPRRDRKVFPLSNSIEKSLRLCTYLWAEDEDHAIKIAAERFAHYNAMQAGIAC